MNKQDFGGNWLRPLLLTFCFFGASNAISGEQGVFDKVKGWFHPTGSSASNSEAAATPPPKPKNACIDIGNFGWRIEKHLDSGVYGVVMHEGHVQCDSWGHCTNYDPMRGILITKDDVFTSEGIIRVSVWIENTDKEPEYVDAKKVNGFDSKFRVFRESPACAYYGPKDLAEARKRYADQEQAQRKVAQETNQKAAVKEDKTQREYCSDPKRRGRPSCRQYFRTHPRSIQEPTSE